MTRAPVLLVGGPGGRGSSTVAADLADRLSAAGQRVLVVDTDPVFGAGSMAGQGVTIHGGNDAAADQLAAFADKIGADARLTDLVQGLVGSPLAAAMWGLPALLERFDAVVVDAGSDLARLALGIAHVAEAIDRLGTAQRGWLLNARPVASLAMNATFPASHGDLLQQTRSRALQVRRVIVDAGRALVLAPTDEPGEAKAHRLIAGVALAGITVGGLVREGDRPIWAPQSVPLWDGVAQPPAWADPLPVPPSRERFDGSIPWRIPLPYISSGELGLQFVEHRLILTAHGFRRVVTLPSLLERYTPSRASVRDGMLEVTFRPRGAR